jgi:hypothetical protein
MVQVQDAYNQSKERTDRPKCQGLHKNGKRGHGSSWPSAGLMEFKPEERQKYKYDNDPLMKSVATATAKLMNARRR